MYRSESCKESADKQMKIQEEIGGYSKCNLEQFDFDSNTNFT
jgi:hypothetical protein